MTDDATVTATAPPGGSATAVSTQPQATVRTVEYTEPSSLPEIQWFWRRAFVFAVTACLAAHIVWTSLRVTDVRTLRETIFYDQCLIALLIFVYVAGGSAEAVVRLVGAVRTSRKETVSTAPTPAALPAVAPPPADKPPWERK